MSQDIIILNGCKLRLVNLNDYQFVQNLFSANDIKKYYVLRDDHAKDLYKFTQFMISSAEQGHGMTYIIEDSLHNKVGLISAELTRLAGQIVWNIGYAVHPSYRKRGYASTALSGFTQYLCKQFAVQSVVLDISESNKDSERVAMKCGFRKQSGGPNMGFYDSKHMELGLRFKWFKQASGRIALFNQAMLLGRNKDYQNAIIYYKKALNEPYESGTPQTDAQIYSNLGMCYSSIRQYHTAFDYLRKAKNMGLTNSSIEKELLWLRNNVGLY